MFDVCLPGHICPNGNGSAAALGNLIHYSVGSFFTGSIVDNDGCAFGSELFGDVSADSLGSACHDRDFSVQFSIFHCVSFIFYFCVHFTFSPLIWISFVLDALNSFR
jgi:hypothetical protein